MSSPEAKNRATSSQEVRRAIAVLVSRFPLITETFILREIIELERQGQPVLLIPMLRETPKVIHEEARPWVERALYTPYLSTRILIANIRTLWRQPGRMVGLLYWIVSRCLLRPEALLKSLALFPKSVYLAEEIVRQGITHLHAHFATHPTTMARIIATLSGASFSFTVHAHDIFVDRRLLREKIRDARFIRSISQFNKLFLENLYRADSGSKIEVVHVGIDPAAYAPTDGVPSPKSNPKRILSIAAFKPYKGLPVLIEACRELANDGADFQCDLIGAGPMEGTIRRLITKHHLGERVHLRGVLPQHEVAAAVRQATVLVLPSIVAADGQMEGIPVALMEAMAAETPVVATALSGIPELVEDRVTGLLADPANPRHLAASIRVLLENDELRERIGVRGRLKVEREFDLQKCVTQLLEIIDRHNTPLADEVVAVVRNMMRTKKVGIRRVHRREDSFVLEATGSRSDALDDLIVKKQIAREGESRPAPVRAADEFRILEKLGSYFREHNEWSQWQFAVPKPLKLDREEGCVLMERAEGVALDQLIRYARRGKLADVERLESAVRGTGGWLHSFQHFERASGAAALTQLTETALTALDRYSGEILGPRKTRAARERLLRLRDELASRPLVGVSHHGDFWPGNIFAADNHIEVIDFEGYGFSLRNADVAYFLIHLELFFSLRSHPRFAQLRRTFFEGYGRGVDPMELEFCTLSIALRLLDRSTDHLPLLHRIVRRHVLKRAATR